MPARNVNLPEHLDRNIERQTASRCCINASEIVLAFWGLLEGFDQMIKARASSSGAKTRSITDIEMKPGQKAAQNDEEPSARDRLSVLTEEWLFSAIRSHKLIFRKLVRG